jgi:hypothetical protein
MGELWPWRQNIISDEAKKTKKIKKKQKIPQSNEDSKKKEETDNSCMDVNRIEKNLKEKDMTKTKDKQSIIDTKHYWHKADPKFILQLWNSAK